MSHLLRSLLLTLGFLCATVPGHCADLGCRRFLVEDRVHVALSFRTDGRAGELSWLDTVSGRSGDCTFQYGDAAVLQVEMPGGWCVPARFVADAALLLHSPPWDPSTREVALGLSLD